MDGWIDELADALAVRRLSKQDVVALLDVARDVAHRVERKVTPLASYVLGQAVGREIANGASPEEAASRAIATLRSALPEEPADAPG